MSNTNILRQTAEELYQREIDALIAAETDPIPTGWKMSPRSVLTYITGNTKVGGVEITPKYMGNRRLVEIAIATLVTDRALLLVGEPGTAKSWLSEHLAAAINGDSTKVIQGTAGTTEEQIRYSWNYAMLIARGPSEEAMVKSPVYRAMETGTIARVEEISRCASEVQDALISILSEKRMSVPELGFEVPARKGFSVIATANTRDKGVNDMSAALKRRFNIVVLPTPADMMTEIDIVRTRVAQMSAGLDLNASQPDSDTVEKIVTIFRELRGGATLDGKQKLKTTSGVLSTAEAISLLANSMALAGSFGSGQIREDDLAAALQGAVVKDEDKDRVCWKEYLENVMKKRGMQGAESVMVEPVYFGVRHLSPAAAYQVRTALDAAQPELVLVEGPSDLNDQMDWLCDPRTRFPVAILGYTRAAPVRTILYPLAIYSPEVQAIRWAREHQVPCRFMDLPSSVFLAMQEREEEQPASTESVYSRIEVLTGEEHDTFWERNFEQTRDYHAACNAFGRELRASGEVSGENIVREAHMKRIICQAGVPPEKIFCVCGAFHVEGLKTARPMTDAQYKKLTKADSTATLMPYSYYRLTNRSGYGAGNQAPAYFRMLWDAMNGEGLESVASTYLVRLAAAHRNAGNIVSSAEVIEALRLAQTLAGMRGSRYPALQDLKDAAITTMGHGNLSELAVAFADTEIGRTIGYLPEGVARTSVQEDFYRQLKKLKLERFRSPELQRLDLDLREKLHVKSRDAALLDLRRSFFLHRLRVLDIHFAGALRSRQDSANWGEYWELRWTPEVEIEVVESSLLGDTIEGAAAFALKERAEQAVSIDQAAGIFQDAFLCGMPAAAAHALTVLQSLSVDAAALTEVAATADKLSLVVRYGDLRRFDAQPVIPLIEQLFLRANLTLEDACNCDAKTAGAVTQAMDRLNLLQLNHDFLDSAPWISLLERISDRDDLNTKCSGFAMAVLLERGIASEELLAREVARRLSPGVPADLGAGWFEGLAGKNRYALITRLSLWRHLSDYLDSLDEDTFRRALVFLRRAFADFTPAEKSDVAENLAEIWGLNARQVAEVMMAAPTAEEVSLLSELDDFDFDDI